MSLPPVLGVVSPNEAERQEEARKMLLELVQADGRLLVTHTSSQHSYHASFGDGLPSDMQACYVVCAADINSKSPVDSAAWCTSKQLLYTLSKLCMKNVTCLLSSFGSKQNQSCDEWLHLSACLHPRCRWQSRAVQP